MSMELSASTYANNGVTSCSSSRWLTEDVFRLIDIVQSDEAIYNPRHKYYFCRPYVENFWREVDIKLEKNPGSSLAKWTNLRISFRREYTNYLEDKVPPCWSYFDRMFFLHPYLRKKYQQHKSLDTQVHDALTHLNHLSVRIQRERVGTSATNTSAQVNSINNGSHSPQPILDNYLEYFDEHDHNTSELDETFDAEQRNSFQNVIDNDIKSECEEPTDDYEHESNHLSNTELHSRSIHDEEDQDHDDITFGTQLTSPPSCSPSTSSLNTPERRFNQQQQSRPQYLNRQMRNYYDEVRAKRPRSQEVQSNSASLSTSTTLQPHTNISFVRPTFTKPIDLVTTTTTPTSNSGIQHEIDFISLTTTAPSANYMSQRHLPHHHQQRLDGTTNSLTSSGSVSTAGSGSAAHLELCDCKTDSDAMFLMSLLPDIQKLNGRDRGKIKIAFQNILQDYLYPD